MPGIEAGVGDAGGTAGAVVIPGMGAIVGAADGFAVMPGIGAMVLAGVGLAFGIPGMGAIVAGAASPGATVRRTRAATRVRRSGNKGTSGTDAGILR